MKYLCLLFISFLILSCSKHPAEQFGKKTENLLYDKAFELRESNQVDSAFLYFFRAKDLFLQQRDSFGAAKCFANLAIIQETKGDYFGSQESATAAMSFFNPKDIAQFNYISINYNTLSIVSSHLKEYQRAVQSYRQAIRFSTDSINKNIYRNNLANAFKKQKRYNEAIALFESLLKQSQTHDPAFARVLSNYAQTRWLQNPNYNPVPAMWKAMAIRLSEADDWGLNSSYAHLADYYLRKQPDSAKFYAIKMLDTAQKIKSPDDQLEALQKLIVLDPGNYTSHFNRFQTLSDSLQTARNKAKNQFALIRYETEKNKSDFLRAQADSIQKQNHIIRQYFIIGIIVLLLVLSFLWFRKRQQRLQLQVKNTELQYSKKVHDRVANRIYQIISFIENTLNPDRNSILFALENVYETSRDISYEKADVSEKQNYRDQLSQMLGSYSSPESTKVLIIGNEDEIWKDTNLVQKTEIYLVLQELMTNMKKHSLASIVSIKFSKDQEHVSISYTDNGVGISELAPKNGLQNMENRIKTINGTIIFETGINNLLKINISFPI